MNEPQLQIYEFGDFRLDAAKRLLTKGVDEPLPLTPKVFDTLLYLVRHNGRVIGKDELMREIWTDSIVEENNLSQNISILRRVLGEKPGEGRFIATVPGHGFRFVPEVREVSEVSSFKFQVSSSVESEISNSESNDESPTKSAPETRNLKLETNQQLKPKTDDRNPNRFRFAAFAVLIILALGSLGFYLWRENEKSVANARIKSIAVLPFVNTSQDPNAEYLSDGITESVINNLSQLAGLKVMSRNSAFRFKNNQNDTRNIASQLGVETLVTGDIKQIGDRLVINVRLIDATDDSQIWGNQYVKASTDIITAQNEIAQAVANNLRLKLTSSEQQRLGKNYTENAEAYQLYLRGRYHAARLTPPETNKGISYFQQAIEIDPNYALAYAGLARAYQTLPPASDFPPTEFFPKAKAAAQKALEIDDRLAEAHAVLGWVIFWYEWDWEAAEIQDRRAIEFNPNSADAHEVYAHLLSNTGRHTEALAEMKRARELDPLNLRINALEGQFLLHAGKIDEALVQLGKTFELSPNFWLAHNIAASAYIEKEMYSEAIAEARQAREFSGVSSHPLAFSGYALAKSGRTAEARAVLEELSKLATERYVPPYYIALVHNGLNEGEQALTWLERGFEQRDAKMVFLKVEPKWNNLRNEPRFIDLMQRMNFE